MHTNVTPFLKFIETSSGKNPVLAYFCQSLYASSMNQNFISRIATEVEEIEKAGLYKKERIITSEQGAEIIVGGRSVLNFCANNYLGLSSHPKVIAAAKKYVLSAARRIYTKSSKKRSLNF